LLTFAVVAASVRGQPNGVDRPRLAVLLVFDQLRGDYLTRWQELFEENGFRRLQREGIWFQNCYYPYAETLTGPGHASLVTGCSPATHGVIGNEWYDRSAGKLVNCVSAERAYDLVPSRSGPSLGVDLIDRKGGRSVSPERLLAPSVGEALKEATGGKGRVVSLSLKDRSAVLLGGRRPDACYWFDTSMGSFVTSTYYRDRLHPWVEAINNQRPGQRWFGTDWTRLRPALDYQKYSGLYEIPGSAPGYAQGRSFPHPLTGGLSKPGKLYYEAILNSPFGNQILVELAKQVIETERLGQSDTPDLLAISFSSNDLIGHCWGPDSQEVLDVTLRSDLLVQDFLAYLDDKVGKNRYIVAVTSDHGICPIPEYTRSQGKNAGRVNAAALLKGAEEFLNKTFNSKEAKLRWFESAPLPWVYLNRRLIPMGKEAEVEETLGKWFAEQPGILTAYTTNQLNREMAADDRIGQSVRRSFYPERSGDVIVVLKPYYLFTSPFTLGTNHGSPHDYDTHVPLLVYGPGIRGNRSREAVPPQAVAAIISRSLGIRPPARADCPVPASMDGPKK
jgi:hypothetical protein